MTSTDHQQYAGPERRQRDRTPPAPPRVVGRARVRPECVRLMLGLDPSLWYDVVDGNPAVYTSPLEGYLWVTFADRLVHVRRNH